MENIAIPSFKIRFLLLTVGLFFLNFYPGFTRQLEVIIPDSDKTLSPYFFVKSETDLENFPLLSTTADVNIAGVIADVTIKQTYKNNGKKTIEAIYVFPASTRAAVYSMEMKIGERVLKAVIQEREKARQTYEEAKNEGRSASLLEQDRPNVFQMNVANILPGDLIAIELKYTELLVPESGLYQFVCPTVVGPRYTNKKIDDARERDKFVQMPYSHSGEKPTYKFDIKLQIDAGMKIEEIFSESHNIKFDFLNDENSKAKIELAKSDSDKGNKDFILSYRLSGDKIKTGLLINQMSNNNDSKVNENYFLLMLQPPRRIEEENIVPREYIFIVDVSGSMYGFPLDISKKLVKSLLKSLNETDKFNILLFSGSSSFLSNESLFANEENIEKGLSFINKEYGYGGTELLPAMRKALNYKKEVGYSRSFLVITDGYVEVETETFDLIRKNLNNANLFAFGIGSSVNRFIIEGIARAGMSEPFIITKPESAISVSEKFFKYVKSPMMTDIKIEFNGFKTYDVEPITIPDVMAERPIIIFGKWKENLQGEIIVKGKSGDMELMVKIPVEKFAENIQGNGLAYLWARNKLQILSDYEVIINDKAREKEIIELGLNYNLLTNYTSFIAEDYIKRADGNYKIVKQPLPMPEGVSDYAIGNSKGSGLMIFKSSTSEFYNRSILTIDGNGNNPLLDSDYDNDDDDVGFYILNQIEKKPSFDQQTFTKDMKNLIRKFKKKDFTIKILVKLSEDGIVEETRNQNINPDSFESEVERLINYIKFNPAYNRGNTVASLFSIVITKRKGELKIYIE